MKKIYIVIRKILLRTKIIMEIDINFIHKFFFGVYEKNFKFFFLFAKRKNQIIQTFSNYKINKK